MVDFTYYSGTYKGTLSSTQFAILEPKAADEIVLLVGRALTETELALDYVKKATCYMTDYKSSTDSGVITESLGSYSYTLDSMKPTDLYSKAMSFLKLAGIYDRSICLC